MSVLVAGRDSMPALCTRSDAHTWLPVQLTIGQFGIPDGAEGRLYLVCTRCWHHTYVIAPFMGAFYDAPPPLVDVLQRDAGALLPPPVQELHDAAQDLLETDAEDERKAQWDRLATAVNAVKRMARP